jgi:glycosyltransferase involved in cell wall biosynthesis
MKRILHIAASLSIGGAEKVARDIGFYADPKEYDIHYVVFGDEIGDYEQELLEHGCKIYHWKYPRESYPAYFHTLLTLMQVNHYDVVHAHTMFSIGWAMLAARLCGVPVRIAHAHSAMGKNKSIKRLVYEKTMRHLILHNATALVACGNAAGIKLYGKSAFEKRGICILNGIDTSAFSYDPEAGARIRKELALEDSFVIGHVGHMTYVKNQSFLIRLMPRILKRKPNAKLLMLGDGNDRPKLMRLINKLGLTDCVIMTGNVRNVPNYLCAMDVFAFPSRFEGMPLSIVEVQANGLPCVLSTGVPRDVYLTDLVHPLPLDRVDAWIDRICTLKRDNPSRYADLLKEAGFDKEGFINAVMKLYQ